jgi:hypothetical protein
MGSSLSLRGEDNPEMVKIGRFLEKRKCDDFLPKQVGGTLKGLALSNS